MLNGGRGSLFYDLPRISGGASARPALSGRLLLLMLAMAAAIASAAPRASAQPPSVRLPGYVPIQVATAHYLGEEDPTQPIQLALTLPLRNQPELHDLLRRLYDPHDPLYGHYLSPAQFDARFAPTDADYQAVIAFAAANGMAITGLHSSRTIVDVASPAGLIEQAFSLHLERYQAPDGRIFHAPDMGPAIPLTLAGRLSAVVGLSNATVIRPNIRIKPRGPNPHGSASAHPNNSGPKGGLGPADIRKAYNLDGASIPDGTGQTLGVFELDGYTASDITDYEDQFGLPHVPLKNVLVDGFSGTPSGNGGEVEVTLDIDMQAALAPKASQIIVYEAPNSLASIIDLYARIAADNSAQSISSSWGIFEPAGDSTFFEPENSAFAQMAAQGQSMYAASGDFGAYADGVDFGASDPATQPFVVGVGGTTLLTNIDGSYLSETTWNADGTPTDGAGGGGISVYWPIPSWQAGVVSPDSLGSTTMRNVPDVSLDADPASGYDISLAAYGGFFTIGGTSAAAPLWSAFNALVNQSRAGVGLPNLGFPNPAIYSLAQGSAYNQEFHDIADGSTNIFYPAVTGYDDATGWGTFVGASLLADLTVPPPPDMLVAKPGDLKAILTWSASPTATGYNVKQSKTKGGPYTTVASNVKATTYTDTGLTDGTRYYYVVSALDGTAEGRNSSEVSVVPNHVPLPPTGLTASYANGVVTLNWTAGMFDSTYSVLRGSIAGGPYTTLKSGVSTTTYSDTKAVPDTTYYYVVSAANDVGVSGNSNEAKITLPPTAPTSPAAAAGNAQVTVSWTASVDATGYNVKRSTTDMGPYTTVGSTTGAVSFVDKGLTNGTTYYYVVSATNTNGEGPDSAQVSATPLAAPGAPTGLEAAPTDSTVTLTWTAPARAETYNIKRSLTSGGPYTTVQTGVTTTTYADTGLTNGTTYHYVVSASGVGGEGPNSTEASAKPVARPGAPTGLAAVAANALVQLTWDVTPSADSYNVKRSVTRGSGYTTIKSGLTSPGYTDTTVKNGTKYYYVVSATNVGGESANSAEVSATPLTPPAVPDGVIATPSNQQVTVSWNSAARASTYTVERSDVSGGPYTKVGAGLTLTSYVDKGLTNGDVYYYVVYASNVGGDSGLSLEANAIPLPPPAAPTNLAASPGNAQVSLTWTGSPDAVSYQVMRSGSAGGPYSIVGANVKDTTFADTTVTNGTTYYYVVTATNLGGDSDESNEVSAEPLAPPDVPTGLTATAGPAQVALAWTAAPRAATYTVNRATALGGPYVAVTKSVTSASYTDTSVTNGTTYYYKVSATNVGGQSPDSNSAHATPEALPAVPDGVAAAPGDSTVQVAWNPAANALMYQLKRSVTSGGPYTMVSDSITSNSFVDNNVTNGTTYYYVVASMGAVGPSADSVQVSATPAAPPAAPTNLKAVAASSSEIDLSWAGDKTARFAVNRSTDGVKFAQVAITGTGALSYADTGLSAGTLYTYRLQALGVGGSSGDSNTTSATTLGSGSISGSVIAKVGSASAPAPNVKITLLDFAGNQLNTTSTDNSGNYSLTGLSNGSYTVQEQSQNQQSPQTQAVTLEASNNGVATGVNFTISSLATIPSGISMVSVPYTYGAGGGDAMTVFGLTALANGSAPVAAYDPVSNQYMIYPNLPGKQVQPGRGYWVRENTSQPFIAAGSPVASPFTESLSPGWNIIGDPFTQALDVNSLQLTAAVAIGSTPAGTALSLQAAKSAGLIGSPFWGYNPSAGAYAQATSLQPFQGYWIYLDPSVSQNQPVKITFTSAGS